MAPLKVCIVTAGIIGLKCRRRRAVAFDNCFALYCFIGAFFNRETLSVKFRCSVDLNLII